ncbi:caspase recruitment domain-containing protein 18-like [Sander vitreus]
MWGDETEQCNGLSVGDVVKVTNMKTNKYYENISLNSTVHTRIEKMDPSRSVPKTSRILLQGRLYSSEANSSPSEAIPAEKKLLKVRKDFVGGVSDANLNQFLDKLLHDGVINDEEMQSINTKSRADKARDLIDTVRRKGTEASSLLISTLREVDPHLSRKLELIRS